MLVTTSSSFYLQCPSQRTRYITRMCRDIIWDISRASAQLLFLCMSASKGNPDHPALLHQNVSSHLREACLRKYNTEQHTFLYHPFLCVVWRQPYQAQKIMSRAPHR